MTALRICCSSPTMAFSVPAPAFFSCDQAALPKDNVKMREQSKDERTNPNAIHRDLHFVFWKQTTLVPAIRHIKFRAHDAAQTKSDDSHRDTFTDVAAISSTRE